MNRNILDDDFITKSKSNSLVPLSYIFAIIVCIVAGYFVGKVASSMIIFLIHK